MNFKKGDIAIYVRPGSPYYGREVEVLSGLEKYFVSEDYLGQTQGTLQWGYTITNLDNTDTIKRARPQWLRPKDEGARDWFKEKIKVKEPVQVGE